MLNKILERVEKILHVVEVSEIFSDQIRRFNQDHKTKDRGSFLLTPPPTLPPPPNPYHNGYGE